MKTTGPLVKELEGIIGKKVVLKEWLEDVDQSFFYNLKKSFQKLLDQAYINAKVTKHLGSGTTGVAFLGTDGKVYKFETFKGVADTFRSMIGKKCKHLPNVYMVYDISYPYVDGEEAKGWIIKKEYIQPLPSSLSDELEDLFNYTDDWQNLDEIFDKKIQKQLLALNLELKQVTGRTLEDNDTGPQNMGLKNRQLALYDF